MFNYWISSNQNNTVKRVELTHSTPKEYCSKYLPLPKMQPITFFALILAIIVLRSINDYIDSKRKKNALYLANGKESTQSLLVKYYDVLGLEYKQAISPQIISKAFHKQLELSTDDRLRGYKPTYSLEELQAAKAYMIHFYLYSNSVN